MKLNLTILSLGLAALLAFGALNAFSAASEQPEFEPAGGEAAFPVPFEINGGEGAMETMEGDRVVCDQTEGDGEISNSTTVVSLDLAFNGCTDAQTGTQCTAEGQADGVIVAALAKAELVYTGENMDVAALWVWPEAGKQAVMAEFTCGTGLAAIDVTAHATVNENEDGGFVCPITPTNEFVETTIVDCNQTEGQQEYQYYWDPGDCAEVEDWFESEGEGLGGWPRQQSALEGEVENMTAEEESVKINSAECSAE